MVITDCYQKFAGVRVAQPKRPFASKWPKAVYAKRPFASMWPKSTEVKRPFSTKWPAQKFYEKRNDEYASMDSDTQYAGQHDSYDYGNYYA